MNSDFFRYLNQLELLAFFSGYPLLYAVVASVFGSTPKKNKLKIFSLLPYAYALTGTLYLGLQLKNLYPDYSLDNIGLLAHPLVLKLLALVSVLFWLPLLSRKPIISLLHSLIFFFLLAKDLFLHAFHHEDKARIRNDMKVFTDSLLLNSASLIVIFILYYFLVFRKTSISPIN
jgi:hypothetical protein